MSRGARGRGIGVDVVKPRDGYRRAMRRRLRARPRPAARVRSVSAASTVSSRLSGVRARGFLRHRADFPVARPGHIAAVRRELAQDHLQQRGFARAVAADQADAAPGRHIGGGAGDDFAAGDADSDVVETQHDRLLSKAM